MRILVVDDHAETRELIARNLTRAAHVVRAAASCAEADRAIDAAVPDVVVLDVMLPDGSGFELCARWRAQSRNVPILLLTARGDVRDRVEGLDAGADDYLVKPFALAELNARVRALGRRGPIVRDRIAEFGAVRIDLDRRQVTVRDRRVPLTAKELCIMEVLANKGGVVPRDHLLESVWGEVHESAQASLEVLIGRIRRKLGAASSVLRTIRGVGYSLESPE
jgi:DNA-binding response OmpR family regulator